MTQHTKRCTQPTLFLPSSMASPKFIRLAPPQAHCVQQGFHYLWCGQGFGRYHVLPGGPMSTQSKNTQHFVEHNKQVKLEPGETITSFDVKALFTSGPVDPSVQIVQHRLSQDTTLPQRTNMSITQIMKLLEFCLKHTYSLFQGKYYEQVHGAAMDSAISPHIANLFMEEFEAKALNTASHPPLMAKVCG